ncbi:MAG: hypothetical protein M3364_03445 [Actinomycetota bacterium]|nr:hypothetical protein [Actinomycetota bacterium]
MTNRNAPVGVPDLPVAPGTTTASPTESALGPGLANLVARLAGEPCFPRSTRAEFARVSARAAVELDPIRRRERVADLRLAAAVRLAPSVTVAEALLVGVAVPGARLDPAWRTALRLDPGNDIVLDETLAMRVVAHGPLAEPTKERRAA